MKEKNLHDELFKATFTMVSEVIAFSKIYLPEWLANQLDYTTLTHEPTSFVSETLSEYFSDIIYSCSLKGGTPIKLTFLLEHKSYVPKNIYIQLLRYLLEIYDSQFKNGEPLTLVIPIVIYHGKDKWHKRTLADYFELPNKKLNQYLPAFNYELIDLDQISDDLIIRQSVGHYLRSTFLVFKHKNEKEFVEQFTEEIFIFVRKELDQDEKLAFLKKLVTYIFSAFKYKKTEINDYFQKISTMSSGTINLAEILFGEELDKREKEMRQEMEKEMRQEMEKEMRQEMEKEVRQEVKKEQLFSHLKNLLNLLKRFPDLEANEYVTLLEGITSSFVRKVKLALQQQKKQRIKQELLTSIFKDMELNRADNQKLSRIISGYLV